jgi:hypothetical protein
MRSPLVLPRSNQEDEGKEGGREGDSANKKWKKKGRFAVNEK